MSDVPLTVESVIRILNALIQADRKTMSLLLLHRIPASPQLMEAGMPTVMRNGVPHVSPLALLNLLWSGDRAPSIGAKVTAAGVLVALGTAVWEGEDVFHVKEMSEI